MKWLPGAQSHDIEDRREESGGFKFGSMHVGSMHVGIGTALVLAILSLVFRTDLSTFVNDETGDAGAAGSQQDSVRDAAEMPLVQFVSFVLDDAQNTWAQLLPQQTGTPYRHAKLVLFRDYVQSGCGDAESAIGPFYCPEDEKVYVDLGFFDELNHRFGAPGQFAQAYILAHELGHHIQKLTGIESKVHRLQGRNSPDTDPLSVKLELQADCLAGVWAHSTEQRGLLEKGDVESALGAASAVGDDRLQKLYVGHVSTELFTHGSSQQRMTWFNRGLDKGTLAACDTFDRAE